MTYISNGLLALDPKWLVAVALVFILIDWILVNSIAFLILGIATLKMAVVIYFFPNSEIVPFLIPIFLLSSFLSQRMIFYPFYGSRSPDEARNILGKVGIVQKISSVNHSKEYFFNYKEASEKMDDKTMESGYLVLEDGRSFTIANIDDVDHQQKAKIIKNINGIVTVRGR